VVGRQDLSESPKGAETLAIRLELGGTTEVDEPIDTVKTLAELATRLLAIAQQILEPIRLRKILELEARKETLPVRRQKYGELIRIAFGMSNQVTLLADKTLDAVTTRLGRDSEEALRTLEQLQAEGQPVPKKVLEAASAVFTRMGNVLLAAVVVELSRDEVARTESAIESAKELSTSMAIVERSVAYFAGRVSEEHRAEQEGLLALQLENAQKMLAFIADQRAGYLRIASTAEQVSKDLNRTRTKMRDAALLLRAAVNEFAEATQAVSFK
jgi:hypothetical protein